MITCSTPDLVSTLSYLIFSGLMLNYKFPDYHHYDHLALLKHRILKKMLLEKAGLPKFLEHWTMKVFLIV